MYYKWDRIIDTGIRSIDNSGILAIGPSGLLRPIENFKEPTNVCFTSGTAYYDGYLLLKPGLLIYANADGHASENKINLRLNEGAFCNGLVVLGTEIGEILYSKTKLQFQDFNRNVSSIKRMNVCGNKVVICGKNHVSLMWEENDKIQFKLATSNYDFVNAYLYRNKIFALSTDGYLNVFFVDENNNIDTKNGYRVNIKKAMKDVEVYNLYVDCGRNTLDIYFLCSSGEVGLIADFNYDKDTIQNIGSDLVLYAAKLTKASFFKDMIKHGNKFIIVGYGEEHDSCIIISMLKSTIISHNILTDINGPERLVYEVCSLYENNYIESGGDINDLTAIITRDIPVYEDPNGNYIKKEDITVDGYPTELIFAKDGTDVNGWVDNKKKVNATGTTSVILSVEINRSVKND